MDLHGSQLSPIFTVHTENIPKMEHHDLSSLIAGIILLLISLGIVIMILRGRKK